MKLLENRITKEGRILKNGIIKVDGFINHQLDPELTTAMGLEFKKLFDEFGADNVTKIVTAETSGIAPAFATAQVYNVPCVFARKHRPVTMVDGLYLAKAVSRTKGLKVELAISKEYLSKNDRVLLIDDFLATASTLRALVNIISQSGAQLVGIGCLIEKVFEKGRDQLTDLHIPILSLAKVDLVNNEIIIRN